MIHTLLAIFISLSVLAGEEPHIDTSTFEQLAIQDGGRVKPFDTFARESSLLITGTQNYKGRNPTELVLSWLFLPDQWSEQSFISVKHQQLKQDLGLKPEDMAISPKSLIENPALPSLFARLMQLQKDKKKLNPYNTAIQRLNNQLVAYKEIISGQGIRLIPQKLSHDWLSIAELRDEGREKFLAVARSYVPAIVKNDQEGFKKAIEDFKTYAKAQDPEQYPSNRSLVFEIDYNKLRPFRLAFVLYLIACLGFLFSMKFVKLSWLYRGAFALTGVGFVIHTLGFIYRCVIAGRPPVSNMYESIIWVAMGTIFFGLIYEGIYKKYFVGIAATAVATLCLIVADSAPTILDQSIRPLEPVLRSNYWLTIHVLTITLSYAAFALAMGIGNIGLGYYARGIQDQNRDKLSSLALFCYRCIQIGVLLLTAGTILGGVWADYSWGRFWGWDPKETWALIADLGYLAILHGRFTGWLKNFGFLASSVLAFVGVIMAWYGVNFVLGVGLHSYGFGGGGVQYVSVLVLIQILFVAFCALQNKKRMQRVS